MDGLAVSAGPDDKASLRRRLNPARISFSRDAQLVGHYERLFAHLASLISECDPIAGYVAHRGEPQILPFLATLHETGRRIVLPHINSAGVMQFMPWTPQTALSPGFAGILQPPATTPAYPGTLLVPLVGFTRAGDRLGQGGGFYDRWFAAHPTGHRIGVAWSCQQVSMIPTDPWDTQLDAVATEIEPVRIRQWAPLG